MRYELSGDQICFYLEGVLNAFKAPSVEREIMDILRASGAKEVRFDASDLDYIASMGLRMVMQLSKTYGKVTVTNVSPEVYEVFATSGIDKLVPVYRKPRELDTNGLKQIGAGAFGHVLRIDAEHVAKIYDSPTITHERIEHERMVAREAFAHGIPSAMPFEVVRADGHEGVIYELIEAKNISETVSANPGACDQWAKRMAHLARNMHTTAFEEGVLPDARLMLHRWVDVAGTSGLYAPSTIEQLHEMVDGIPKASTFVHGDFHPANVMVMPDGELILIDMGDASTGHPLIDLAGTCHVMRIVARRPGAAKRLCGMVPELVDQFWRAFTSEYFDTTNEVQLAEIERVLTLAALPRTMGSNARSKFVADEVRATKAAELEQTFLTEVVDKHFMPYLAFS